MDTLSPFAGFVAGGAATTVPSQFFTDVLPAITDEAELRTTLYALYAIGRTRGAVHAVRASVLASEGPLLRTLAVCAHGEDVPGVVRTALAAAAAHGVLLACPLPDGDTLYFLHTESARRAIARVQSGALVVPSGINRAGDARGDRAAIADGNGAAGASLAALAAQHGAPSSAAQVYEQEIGVLSPAVADAVQHALEQYPEPWIVDAIRLAAERNARSWRYVEGILRRWQAEGRNDAASGRSADDAAADPYSRVVRHDWP